MKNFPVLNSKDVHNLNLFQIYYPVFKPQANFGPLHVNLNLEMQRGRGRGKDVKLR